MTTALATQQAIITDYIVRLGFTNFQRISGAVAQLKKNDLQEIFRELIILNSLLGTMMNNSTLISATYLDFAKANKT